MIVRECKLTISYYGREHSLCYRGRENIEIDSDKVITEEMTPTTCGIKISIEVIERFIKIAKSLEYDYK